MKHQRIARLIALSIPFATALPLVSAAPRDGAPAYGYRRGQNRDNGGYGNGRSDNGDYNNGDYSTNGDYGNQGQFQTLRGTVNDVRSTREFDLRVNGQIVRVKSDSFLNLRRGDIVDVRGDFRGQTLYAETVSRRDDNIFDNGGRDRRVDVRGEIIELDSRTSFRVRADNGRVYAVHSIGNLKSGVSRGDFVRVQGQFDGSFVRARNDDVDVIRDGAYPYGTSNDYNRRINFPATVRTVERGQLEVRGDNGRTYQVRTSTSAARFLRAGDRVQVQGTTRNGYVQATSIERLR